MFQRSSLRALKALNSAGFLKTHAQQRSFSSLPKLIQQLRKSTGAPMMECKKALGEVDNDYEKATEWLRKNGQSKAASKVAGREASEGMVGIAFSSNEASIVRVSSETDFASRSSDFTKLVGVVADGALVNDSVDGIFDVKINDEKTIKDVFDDAILSIRENLQIASAEKIVASSPNSILAGYVHGKVSKEDEAGTSAAIVELVNNDSKLSDYEIIEIGKKLAMHIVAAKPTYLDPEDVPCDIIEKEKQLLLEQMDDSGKPANILERIVTGRMRKYYEGVCLTEQDHMLEEGNPKVSKFLGDHGLKLEAFKSNYIQ
uniref:Elongation factor Ts, mitochondrial n=1 Tax=Chaetoceros debilis TaxID=122233 RepID=A0A7S3PVG0_9STRA|mmetsp:Transcript_4674/g.6522  ORF Transcript_4674/g.6522 Transcript_4674/m.6522 type:complete len:316 (+) Transcript_4674:88-1035(+)